MTCVIRYEIDPCKHEAFTTYARNWGQVIPRCGADLVGNFAPPEGSSTVANGIYHVDSLAAYEAYRERLAADPLDRENYRFAQIERFLRREDRLFLRQVLAPHSPLTHQSEART
ncbi:MAG: NIPSNAP family protein [Proteobacteria bacterium]|nr:MAG: NIPSNAP family protein [Pseudomonadota bacterium]